MRRPRRSPAPRSICCGGSTGANRSSRCWPTSSTPGGMPGSTPRRWDRTRKRTRHEDGGWVGGGKRNEFRPDVRRGAEAMATGTIKRLVRERGFGFIQGHDGVELFFHRSALQGEAFDTLSEGQVVTFDVEKGDKGPRAANMKVSPPSA